MTLPIMTPLLKGRPVKLGDSISFKSDFEQYGKVIKIEGHFLTLHKPFEGFEGDYIGGDNSIRIHVSECFW